MYIVSNFLHVPMVYYIIVIILIISYIKNHTEKLKNYTTKSVRARKNIAKKSRENKISQAIHEVKVY